MVKGRGIRIVEGRVDYVGYRLKRVCGSQKGMITMGEGRGIRIVEEGDDYVGSEWEGLWVLERDDYNG